MRHDKEADSEAETVGSRLLSPDEDRNDAHLQRALVPNIQILATPALEEAHHTLENLIASSEFGFCIYCSSRNGKDFRGRR